MTRTYKTGWVCWLLALFLCSACSSDDELIPSEESDRVQLSLTIGTGSNLLTRGKTDPNALSGEFIHSLCVFIVNESNVIEQKMLPDFSNDPLAKEGNLKSWYSGTFTIETGRKSIYAFANWETANSDRWNAIINRGIGESLTAADLDFAVDAADGIRYQTDEAGNLQLTSFIPMTAKTEVALHVTGGAKSAELNLVRLASRVEVSFENKETESLTFKAHMESFAEEVSLFPDEKVYKRTVTKALTSESGDPFAGAMVRGGITSKTYILYVNETKASNAADQNFNIKVEIVRAGGKKIEQRLKTQRSSLARNTIYPISLSFSQYQLHLKVSAQIAPIGVMPIETHSQLGMINDYAIVLPEGCTFQIEAKLNDQNQEVTGLTYIWKDMRGALDGATFESPFWIVKNPVVSGHISALPGGHNNLFLFLFIQGNNSRYPDYTIGIQPVPLKDYFMQQTKSASVPSGSTWEGADQLPERLTLFTHKKGGIE